MGIPLNFPNTPALNQLWPQPAQSGLPVYRWDGEKWTTWSNNLPVTPNFLSKNYIINGSMRVSQENGGAAGAVSGYFPVDQFFVNFTTTGTLTIQQAQSLTPGGSPNRIRVTVGTADTTPTNNLNVVTRLEGLTIADLRMGYATARTFTLQFGVRAPPGTYCVSFRNFPVTRSYVAEYTIAGGEGNIDVVRTITVPGDIVPPWTSDNSLGLSITFATMPSTVATQTTPGSWQAGNFVATANQFLFMGTAGNIFELFDVGLYAGSVAPPFQVPDYGSELDQCKRYWQRIGGAQAGDVYIRGYNTAGAGITTTVGYTTELRAIPVVTVVGNWNFGNCTSISNTYAGTRSIGLNITPTAAADTYASNTANGSITLSARL